MSPLPSRLRRAFLVVGMVAAAVVVLGALAAWWFRDLPRRQVEEALRGRLEAEVDLGALQIDGPRRFVLRDLRIRRIAGQPLVESVAVERLIAEGGVREILAGRFELLDLDGVEVRVSRPEEPPPEPSGPGAEVAVDRLVLSRGRAMVAIDGVETSFAFHAEARDVGSDAAGTLRAHGDRLSFENPRGAAAVGFVDDIDLRASLAPGGSVRGTLSAGDGSLRRGERTFPLPPLTLEASARRGGNGGAFAFDAQLETPLVTFASARGEWDPAARALGSLDARVGGARLSALAAFVPALPEGIAVEGLADLEVRQETSETLSWTLRLPRGRIEIPSSVGAEIAELDASGTVPAADPAALGPLRFRATVERAWGSWDGVAIPAGLVPLHASFEGALSSAPGLVARGDARASAPALGAVTATGSVDFSASTVEATWRWNDTTIPALDALARDALGEGIPPTIVVHGRIEAEGTVRGPLPAPVVAGKVTLLGLQGSTEVEGLGRVSFTEGESTARLSTRFPGGTVEVPSLVLAGTARAGDLDPVPVRIDAGGRWLSSPAGADLARLTVDLGDLARVEADGNWRSAGAPRARGTVRIGGLDLARLQAFLRPWIGDPFPGFSVKGKGEAQVAGFLSENATWQANGTGAIRGSGFTSEDGAKVLEGFDTSWDLDFRGTTAGDATARGTADVGGFVALWDTFFADYSGLPSAAEVRGSFRPASDADPSVWGGSLDWSWPDGGTVRASLSSRTDGALGYSVSLKVDDLSSSLDRYLRGPLGDTVPWFERIEGSGAVDGRVAGTVASGRTTARGSIGLDGVRLAGTQGLVEVEGLHLDLPFDLAFETREGVAQPAITGGKGTGSLSFDRLRLSGLEVAAVRTGLSVDVDSVALEEPLAVPMLGGGLGFERLRLADALRPSRRLVTAMLVHAIDLGQVARAFELPPLDGAADGYFPRIELTGQTLKVDGGGGVEVFGGRVDIGDISGEDLLTRFPKMNLSLEFQGIDLERVTKVFDFGSMTGVLHGYAHDVELFRGTPTRFDARIESTDRGRERIDVKAINNIAILGTGGKVSAFDRGIHKFLDTFYYSKLGITLQLVNDVFLMRGLEERGERELFLKGALPFRIDIVNVKPGQTTSFRSMLERMKSVDFKVGG